jgi:hypothetical protein
MNVTRLSLFFLFALPLAPSLAADNAAEVRAALGKLTGQDPIRATYELQRAVANEGKFNDDNFTGKVSVELEGDANGYRIAFARPVLDQIERELQAEARDPKKTMPMASALDEIRPVDTANAIDFAPVLLRMLEGAKVVGDAQGTWAGKPAHVMVFRLLDEPHKGPGKITVAENKLTLWLGADHVPLAAEHLFSAKFSILLIKGETKRKHSWHFARVGDRLVRARHEGSDSGSGLGQKGSESVLATVKVH